MGDEKIGQDEKKKTSNVEGNYKGGSTVRIVFKENRTIDIRLNGEWLRFGPYEEKEIQKSLLTDKNWPHESRYFTVKE